MIGALLGLALIELTGGALIVLMCAEPERLARAERFAVAFGIGLIALPGWLFVCSLCGLTPSWSLGLAGLAMFALPALLFSRDRMRSWFVQPWLADWRFAGGATGRRTSSAVQSTELILVVFIATALGLASAVALLEPIAEWDVIAVWALKAKVLLHEPASSSSYFTDLSKAYSHLDYPLLWPLAIAWEWVAIGHVDLVTVKVLAPALLVTFAAVFYGAVISHGFGTVAIRNIRLHGLLFTALLVGTPMLLAQAARLSADVPLALFALLAFSFARRWLFSGHADDIRLSGFFIVGMLFTKSEGASLALALVGALMAELVVERGFARLQSVLLWLVAVPAALTLPWFFFHAGLPKDIDYAARMVSSIVIDNASRIPVVLGASASYLGSFEDWIFFWPLFAAGLLLGTPVWLRRRSRFLALGVTLAVAMYGYIYVIAPWDVVTLMEASANRLLLHVFGIAALLLAEVVSELWPEAVAASPDRELVEREM